MSTRFEMKVSTPVIAAEQQFFTIVAIEDDGHNPESIVAYCYNSDHAERIAALLALDAAQQRLTKTHHHELARAITPHLTAAVRNASGTRNF